MKIKVLILFATVLCSNIFSQSFYVRLQSGYGISIAAQNLTDYTYVSSQSNGKITRDIKSYSLGKGLYLGGSFGYVISRNIDLNLDLQYLSGSSSSYSTGNYHYSNTSTENIYRYDFSGNAFLIIPSILLKTDLDFVKPYLKVGPILGFAGITNRESFSFSDQSGLEPDLRNRNKSIIEYELLFNGGMALGFNAVFGVSREIIKNTEIFLEINSKTMSYAPTKGEVKKYTIDGKDNLSELSTSNRQIVFSETVVDELNVPADPNKPSTELRNSYPFSSLIFSLGLSYNF